MLYKFYCESCDKEFSVEQKANDVHEAVCDCGLNARRVWTLAGIAFKGAGFHVNDYKKGDIS